MDNYELFRERLAAIRDSRGWSIAELARRADVSKGSMESYFRGHKPGFTALISISRATGVGLDHLCGLSDEAEARLMGAAALAEVRAFIDERIAELSGRDA